MNTDPTTKPTSAPSQVSPDAEAIEQARGVLVRYRGDIATWQYGDLVGDIAAALTAATMREREACALVANAVGEIFDRLGDGAAATVADGIRDAIRARSASPPDIGNTPGDE